MSARPALTVLTALIVGVVALAGPVAAAPAPGDGPPGALVYQRSAAQRTLVTLVGADGTGVRSPWRGLPGQDQTNPDPDPTSRRIAFTMGNGATDDLWVGDLDGGGPRKLLACESPCLWIDDASWSPDGRRIVFSRTTAVGDAGVSTLEVVEVATGRVEVVLGPWVRSFTAGARWSPDGRHVVFERVHKTGVAADAGIDGVVLSVVHVRGTTRPPTDLTRSSLFAATADWRPDGRRIVYSALPRPGAAAPDLFTVSPTGGRPARVTRLAPRGGFAAEPTYVGCRIVFSGRPDASLGEPLLLAVAPGAGRGATGVVSATGERWTPGRHPRELPGVSAGRAPCRR